VRVCMRACVYLPDFNVVLKVGYIGQATSKGNGMKRKMSHPYDMLASRFCFMIK